jgi:hypothetical protein
MYVCMYVKRHQLYRWLYDKIRYPGDDKYVYYGEEGFRYNSSSNNVSNTGPVPSSKLAEGLSVNTSYVMIGPKIMNLQ